MSEDEVAFAELQAACKPGDEIIIHAEDCPCEVEGPECPCEPVVLVCVAEAARA